MQHKLGYNYKEVLKSRKNKRDFPDVGKLLKVLDIEKLQSQLKYFLSLNNELDTNSTETRYGLNKKDGTKFINDYDRFIVNYSNITFHKMTREATNLAEKINRSLEEYSPLDRLKGMVDTGSKFYHPYYDERNYTEYTDFADGYIKEVLEDFQSVSCRSAIVVLRPGQAITKHFDIGPEYIIRLQIPIITNENCIMGFKSTDGWNTYHLPADGSMYAVNAGLEHWAINAGNTTRYHLRICLTSQEDTEGMPTLSPVGFISDQEFTNHACAK